MTVRPTASGSAILALALAGLAGGYVPALLCGLPAVPTGTYRGYDVRGAVQPQHLLAAAKKALANDVVHEVLLDALPACLPGQVAEPDLAVHPIPLAHLDQAGLEQLSLQGGLALDGAEMTAIQRHFQ